MLVDAGEASHILILKVPCNIAAIVVSQKVELQKWFLISESLVGLVDAIVMELHLIKVVYVEHVPVSNMYVALLFFVTLIDNSLLVLFDLGLDVDARQNIVELFGAEPVLSEFLVAPQVFDCVP